MKEYFDKENINNTFVGHPLLEKNVKSNTDLSNLIKNEKIIIFAGSRLSEIRLLLPILLDFVKLMNDKFNNFLYVFHTTENKNYLNSYINESKINNIEVISEENIKSQILSKSIFAVSKSGTVSLEICNAKIPSIIIYKMNFLNFLIVEF